jgi:tetratricopeptide (TPR) repeat protein
MKKVLVYMLPALILLLWSGAARAEDASTDPGHLFAKGNSLYERRDYEKALDEYKKVLDRGVESGPLYYNIGNAYFKLGKIGYAILYYKKALRLTPADSDLKSNLGYAQSLTEDSALTAQGVNRFAWLVRIPFKEFTLNGVARILASAYIALAVMLIGGIINRVFARRVTLIFYPVLMLFMLTLAAFVMRYYDEEVLTRAVVVTDSAECRYEPIDKSNVYFTLKKGQEISVLKSRNGWSRIKRLDGKLGWVKSDTVEEE